MAADTDERVTLVRNGILAAIVKEASATGFYGPFSLDDILHAWLKHDAADIAKLPDPPWPRLLLVEPTTQLLVLRGLSGTRGGGVHGRGR